MHRQRLIHYNGHIYIYIFWLHQECWPVYIQDKTRYIYIYIYIYIWVRVSEWVSETCPHSLSPSRKWSTNKVTRMTCLHSRLLDVHTYQSMQDQQEQQWLKEPTVESFIVTTPWEWRSSFVNRQSRTPLACHSPITPPWYVGLRGIKSCLWTVVIVFYV